MPEANLIIKFLFFAVLAGMVGTAGLSGFLSFLTRAGVARVPMVEALGSLLTRSRHRAVEVGLLLHVLAGIFFGMFYTWALMAIGQPGVVMCLFLGVLIGLLHGILFSICLIVIVAESHPLEEFKQASIVVAFVHALAHVIYGALVGFVIGLSGLVHSIS